MTYKIAIATSDGQNVDTSFGEANRFIIYEINDKKIKSTSERLWSEEITQENSSCEHGSGKKCGLSEVANKKIELISDCRVSLCSKFGIKIQKALERKAIAAFDVEEKIDEALKKIVRYYDRIDSHRETLNQ